VPEYGRAPEHGQVPEHGPPPGYGPAPEYGTTPAYGSPYGGPPYGSASAYALQPDTPEQSSLRMQAVVALVINVIVVLATCFMALPSIGGAITAGIALGQVRSDVDGARRLVRWSWGLLITTVAIAVLLLVFLVVVYATLGSTSP
jgi:hypothetical protein